MVSAPASHTLGLRFLLCEMGATARRAVSSARGCPEIRFLQQPELYRKAAYHPELDRPAVEVPLTPGTPACLLSLQAALSAASISPHGPGWPRTAYSGGHTGARTTASRPRPWLRASHPQQGRKHGPPHPGPHSGQRHPPSLPGCRDHSAAQAPRPPGSLGSPLSSKHKPRRSWAPHCLPTASCLPGLDSVLT